VIPTKHTKRTRATTEDSKTKPQAIQSTTKNACFPFPLHQPRPQEPMPIHDPIPAINTHPRSLRHSIQSTNRQPPIQSTPILPHEKQEPSFRPLGATASTDSCPLDLSLALQGAFCLFPSFLARWAFLPPFLRSVRSILASLGFWEHQASTIESSATIHSKTSRPTKHGQRSGPC
jgi:hypothetical protein